MGYSESIYFYNKFKMLTENHRASLAQMAQYLLAGIILGVTQFPQTYPQGYQRRYG